MVAVYFSTETITSVGYGDISPNSPLTTIICTAEMVVGLFFAVFIVSGALAKFAEPHTESSTELVLKRGIAKAHGNKKSRLKLWLSVRLRWVQFRDGYILRSIRRFSRKFHVLVSLTVEFFAMLLLVVYSSHTDTIISVLVVVLILQVTCTKIDPRRGYTISSRPTDYYLPCFLKMLPFQFLVFGFNMVVSLRYVRRVNEVMHTHAHPRLRARIGNLLNKSIEPFTAVVRMHITISFHVCCLARVSLFAT